MIEIRKGREPEDLEVLRQSAAEKGLSPRAAYKKLKGKLKSQIRQNLVDEQDVLEYCIAALSEFQTEVNPKTPYVGALIWYLQAMIDGLSNT